MGSCAGTRSSGVTSLEKRVLQQYLSARQLRDKAAEERGVPSPSRRYSSAKPPPQQPGVWPIAALARRMRIPTSPLDS